MKSELNVVIGRALAVVAVLAALAVVMWATGCSSADEGGSRSMRTWAIDTSDPAVREALDHREQARSRAMQLPARPARGADDECHTSTCVARKYCVNDGLRGEEGNRAVKYDLPSRRACDGWVDSFGLFAREHGCNYMVESFDDRVAPACGGGAP